MKTAKGGTLHTKEYKEMMSEKRRKWWEELRKDKEKYQTVVNNIGKGSEGRFQEKGEKSNNWKGGRYTTKRDGYVHLYCPDHPMAKKSGSGSGGYVLEHRLVMEKMIGRFLDKSEDVHHRNGVKDDNRPENLMLVTHFQHFEEHGCPKCGFKTYTH